MSKNILVLTGSPRKGGNSDKLAEAFIKGAESKGHKVSRYDSGRKNIKPCRACNNCYSKGSACIFEDDFSQLAPLMEAADMIVLATPLYWFNFTAQIKAAIDKMYALYIGQKSGSIRESILLTCGETENEEDFDSLIKTYQQIAAFSNWQDAGILKVLKVREKDDILKTDALRKAEEMGENI